MQVFVSNIHGQEAINAKAAALGLKAGQIQIGSGYKTIPAVGGNTFDVKDALKAAGAKWHGGCKVWVFETQTALETALSSLQK